MIIIYNLLCDQSFLDALLMEIRGKSISYLTYKKKKTTELEKKLEQEILLLEQNFTENLKMNYQINKQNYNLLEKTDYKVNVLDQKQKG